jgi:hypothetical protein
MPTGAVAVEISNAAANPINACVRVRMTFAQVGLGVVLE